MKSNFFGIVVSTIIIILGIVIRIWRVDEMFIFADEIHTIQNAINNSYIWIATHSTGADSCIPLSLYAKLLLSINQLNELTLRLPSVAFGIFLLLFTGWFSRHFVGHFESIISAGIIAFSPYWVYLSREARPYPIAAFTFALAVLFVVFWKKNHKDRYLFFAAILSAISMYFHIVVSPAVAVLGLYTLLWHFFGENSSSRLKPILLAYLIFVLFFVLLVFPSIISLSEIIYNKKGQGYIDFDTVRNGIMLLLGFPFKTLFWGWLTLFLSDRSHY